MIFPPAWPSLTGFAIRDWFCEGAPYFQRCRCLSVCVCVSLLFSFRSSPCLMLTWCCCCCWVRLLCSARSTDVKSPYKSGFRAVIMVRAGFVTVPKPSYLGWVGILRVIRFIEFVIRSIEPVFGCKRIICHRIDRTYHRVHRTCHR